MKYLTKDWYKSMQRTSIHLLLKISEKAEMFSEEYYNIIYNQEKEKWIKLQEEISNVKFEEAFPEYDSSNILSENENKERERLLIKFNEKSSFDLKQAKRQFNQLQKEKIEYLKYKLPKKILDKVADVRVLALDRVSNSIKKEITNYCNEQKVKVKKALTDYQQYYNSEVLKDSGIQKIEGKLHLHDSLITNILKGKEKLIVEVASSKSISNINRIIFDNYIILEEEMNFTNSWWLYEELYIVENQYELHVLLHVPYKNDMKLGYFTIRAKNIIVNI